MEIICDQRERKSGLPGRLEALGAPVLYRQMPVGDYLLAPDLLVERKTLTDLSASIREGRMRAQMERLQAHYARPVILVIEQGYPTLPQRAHDGALAGALRLGIRVAHVPDNEAAAALLFRMWKQEERGPLEKYLHVPKKAKTRDDQAVQLTALLPGIGVQTARQIMSHFGSLQDFANATEKELRACPGIGKVRARTIYELWRHRYDDIEAVDY